MRKTLPILALGALLVGFGTGPAMAQSSGNFTAEVQTTACVVNRTDGMFTGGLPQGSEGSFTTKIKLPNSSPALLITPSLVTGLYTLTSLTSNGTATANGAIVVNVTDNGTTISPDTTCVDTAGTGCTSPGPTCVCGVDYDQRFQQLTFSDANSDDSIKLVQSTLSAHSFNFVEPNVSGGTHSIVTEWVFGCPNANTGELTTHDCQMTTTSDQAACVGPGSLTVEQVQNFQFDSPITTK